MSTHSSSAQQQQQRSTNGSSSSSCRPATTRTGSSMMMMSSSSHRMNNKWIQAEEGNSNSNNNSSSRPRQAIECPRLVSRNMIYHQSRNCVQVKHNHGIWQILLLQRYDWFHVILRVETWKSLLALLSLWTVLIIVFAGFYVAVDQHDIELNCGLGDPGFPIGFGPAFAFSLETCTTVGYGLPNSRNAFFENCPSLQVVIFFQMVWSMMFNAFLFAFFYSRVAKCDARGAQVVLSNKAIVTMVDGQVRFQVRVYDVDAATPVVEAHIRMYAVTKSRPVPRPLRIIQPDDELGSTLFLSVPTVVAHQIDLYSILHPPRPTPVNPGGLILRQADSFVGNRDGFICPVCGESYGTYERWRNHVKYQRIVEEKDDYPVDGTHLQLDEKDFRPVTDKKFQPNKNIKELEAYFRNEISEIICVVEAIEPISSGTFAALHSYRVEDVVFHFGARFSPCVEAIKMKHEEFLRVDLDRFHGIDIDNETLTQSPSSKVGMRSLRKEDGFFSAVRTAIRQPPSPKKPKSSKEAGVFDVAWWDHQSTNSAASYENERKSKTNSGGSLRVPTL